MMSRYVCGLIFVIIATGMANAAGGTLKDTAHAVSWTGSIGPEDAGAGDIPECASVPCDRFDLTIDLPGGVWNQKPGGVEVAIRWGGLPFDNLRLYIYRNGTRIAAGEGIISVAQSLLLSNAADGLYRIYVARDPDSPSSSIAYDAVAHVVYPPNPHPARPLLPDFIVLPQRNLSFDPGGIFFDNISAQYPTCYETEVQEEGARLCLRFDQNFGNIGEGAMDLRFKLPHGQTPPAANAYQRLYQSDGSTFQDRLAGQVEFHQAHGHYHFRSFGLSSLWRVDQAGVPMDSQPVRRGNKSRPIGGQLTRTGRKVSFCMADIGIVNWASNSTGPRTYNAPDCLAPASSDADFDYFTQGITSGWMDVYDWYLPDQYMDVSGVPDGIYLLQTEADPDGLLVEADRSNNCGGVFIQLSNMATSAPSAHILGPAAACAGTAR
jgi:hypothetical protein